MQEKFDDALGSQYLLNNGLKTLTKCLEYFTKNNQETSSTPEVRIPTKDSTFSEILVFVLLKIDTHFNANVFRKVDPTLEDEQIVQKASFQLPSIHLTGMKLLI